MNVCLFPAEPGTKRHTLAGGMSSPKDVDLTPLLAELKLRRVNSKNTPHPITKCVLPVCSRLRVGAHRRACSVPGANSGGCVGVRLRLAACAWGYVGGTASARPTGYSRGPS